MPTIDLSPLKAQLESSASTFTGLSKDLSSQVTGAVSNVVPQLGTLQDALPGAISSISDAAKGLGTNILGSSPAALPNMQSLLKGLTPNLDSLKGLADSALKGLSSASLPSLPGLKDVIGKISAETEKVQSATTAAVSSIDSQYQQGTPVLPLMIDEIEGVHSTLATYYNDLGAYLFAPGANPLPTLDTESLNIDQLYITARNNKDSAVDLTAGAIHKVIYKVSGLVREVGTRLQTKAMLYDKAITEAGNVQSDLIADSGKSVSELRSTTPYQTEGT